MAIRAKALLKSYFKRGLYPTAAQFADWLDSYFHKTDDTIPISSVDELSDRLNAKYDLSDGQILEEKTEQIHRNLETHKSDADYKFSQIDGEIENLNSEDTAIREDFATGDSATLQSANEYTDSKYTAVRLDFATGDSTTLQSAQSYADQKVANIVNTAPEALDTLQELAAALGDDPNFATTIMTEVGKKVDKVAGATLMSSADKSKLDGIDAGATAYAHPATHPATMIVEDVTHRFITDTERQAWNSKPSGNNASQSIDGLMSSIDKVKLDGIDSGANNYTHPNDANTRHVTDTEKTNWDGMLAAAKSYTDSKIGMDYSILAEQAVPGEFALNLNEVKSQVYVKTIIGDIRPPGSAQPALIGLPLSGCVINAWGTILSSTLTPPVQPITLASVYRTGNAYLLSKGQYSFKTTAGIPDNSYYCVTVKYVR